MKTATKIADLGIHASDIRAYEVDGRAYVSMSEIARSTRGNKSTRPIQAWLDTTSKASQEEGSQGFPQGPDTTLFEATVKTNSGVQVAKLLTPGMAFNFWIYEATNRSAEVAARAISLIQVVGAAGFETICQEALGLRVSVEENLTAAVRLQADLAIKAQDIQRLKLAMYQALLPFAEFESIADLPKDDRRYPIFKEIQLVINSLYARLDEGVHDAIKVVQKSSPRRFGRAATKYSCLTEEARTALKPVINAYITAFSMLQAPATILDVKRVIESIDRIYPRYC